MIGVSLDELEEDLLPREDVGRGSSRDGADQEREDGGHREVKE